MENPFTAPEQDVSPVESPIDLVSPPSDNLVDYPSDFASPNDIASPGDILFVLSDIASPPSDVAFPSSGADPDNGTNDGPPAQASDASPDRLLHLGLNRTPTRSPRRRFRWSNPDSIWKPKTPPKPRKAKTPKEKAGRDDPDFEEYIGMKRTKASVEPNEYRVMASVFKMLSSAPAAVQDWFESLGDRPRNRLGKVCEVAAVVADRAVVLADSDILRIPRAKDGRPRNQPGLGGVGEKIVTIIAESNKLGIPNSAGYVANKLREVHGINKSVSTITRYLKKELDMYYGKGIRQNMMHDAPANVDYRYNYLKERLGNLEMVDGKYVPKFPEVFLDESCCHLDHAAANRWVPKGDIVTEPGRGPLLVIFAAFVVYYDRDNHRMESKFVQDSVYIWPAIGKAHLNTSKRSKDGDNDNNVWNNVPQEIFKTPPYHSELQPIEKIWAVVKNAGEDEGSYTQEDVGPVLHCVTTADIRQCLEEQHQNWLRVLPGSHQAEARRHE
ncbi:hypothetical protein EDD21DRAFT_380294 [Dissophora ornata]|nr:hypothetical protein EDD21DRAFT_380294 [Dissophora ornata]